MTADAAVDSSGNRDMHPDLAHPSGPARGGEPCRVCGGPISRTAHPTQRIRHVCGPPCNERLKRALKRAREKEKEASARLGHEVDPGRPRMILYEPHVEWTSPGGRGYAERLWFGVRGGYAFGLSTGMVMVGRTNSAGKRLSTHFKHCQNYGVTVHDVAVIASAGDLALLEQSLKWFIKSHPDADDDPSIMESAHGVPFADVVDFALRESLGDLWIPTHAVDGRSGANPG
ncbi:hypothetical protein AB0H12_22385 [Actinosynnema sp. NPDC023794]